MTAPTKVAASLAPVAFPLSLNLIGISDCDGIIKPSLFVVLPAFFDMAKIEFLQHLQLTYVGLGGYHGPALVHERATLQLAKFM